MPNPMICTIPSPDISPILRALVESEAVEVVAAPEPYDLEPPKGTTFTRNRHERRKDATHNLSDLLAIVRVAELAHESTDPEWTLPGLYPSRKTNPPPEGAAALFSE